MDNQTTLSTLPANVRLRRDQDHDTIVFLRAPNLSAALERDPTFRQLQAENRYVDIVLAFLSTYRELFHLQQPADEMRLQSVKTDRLGLTHVRLQQIFAGIPVWGAELIVHLDHANHVYLVQGRYTPTPSDLNTRPALNQATIERIIAATLEQVGPGCSACRTERIIFITSDQTPRLAYRVDISVSLQEGWIFIVDATSGAILDRQSTAMHRNGQGESAR